jgi:DnaJ-class molecular chaperone
MSNRTEAANNPITIPLDDLCYDCGGEGQVVGPEDTLIECAVCRGMGRIPNELGLYLLNLLARYKAK